MKSKWIVVVVAACVVVAIAASAASADTPLVVNLAGLEGASAAAPSAATVPGSDCSGRAVTSSFHEHLGSQAVPILPVEDLPADAVSVPTWSGSFTTAGTTYPYTMVGTDPAAGSTATHVPVEIIPLNLDFPNDCVLGDSSMAADIEASPLFTPTDLPTGDTQYLDDYQRSDFWSTVGTVSPDYHLLLDAYDIPPVTLHVPASQGLTGFDPRTNRIEGVVGGKWMAQVLKNLVNSLHISPKTLAVFVPYNTYVTDQNPNDCLTPASCSFYLGYHTAALSTANPHGINTYAMASFLDDGIDLPASLDLGSEVLSHEILEWANDPFAYGARVRGESAFFANTAPAWSSPYFGASQLCTNILEVADPLEGGVLLGAQADDSSTIYLLADGAFLSWFARQSPSTALGGLYDLGGVFPSYSDSC